MATESQLTDLIKRSFVEMMKDIGTSIPAHILSFDPSTQLAQIQIGIKRVDIDGKQFAPPPLIEAPVYFAGGDKFFIEHQIDAGDEGIVLFSQRCIDAWVNTGGIAENPILRFHDFSDCYFLPGLRSQPKAISAFQNNGIRMSNKAGSEYIWLKNDGTSEITVPTLNINANVNIVGNVSLLGAFMQTGTMTVIGNITGAIVTGLTGIIWGTTDAGTHDHNYVNPDHASPTQPGITGGPNP